VSAGTFIIQERPDLGGLKPRAGAVRFEWDAEHRNAPLQPWPGGVTQRTARIDYPGADNPTEQVLGPNFKSFSLSGRWRDKYNPLSSRAPGETDSVFGARARGYAIKELNAFLAMVRRGNMVEISFKSLTFFGIITDFDWEYYREYDIGYTFTVSPHRRPGSDELDKPVSPLTVRDANTLAIAIDARASTTLDIESTKPAALLAGDASALSTQRVADVKAGSDDFSSVVSNRVLKVNSDPLLSVQRAVSAGDILIGRAQSAIGAAGALKSSTALIYHTALGVLDFETWNRGLAAEMRLIAGDSYSARQQLDEQAEPNAIALYRPFENESLYSISNRFYGTPHNWRLIKERNRLSSSNLTGTELLIIPEAPPQ